MLPTGTVTLFFSDIEGSTRLLERLGASWPGVLARQREILRAAFGAHGGHEVDTQGDAFFAAFARAGEAVAAATQIQRALADEPWPHGEPVRVRIGLHTGEPERTAEGYAGVDLHRAARIMAAGHGGQTLLSQSTRDLAQTHLPAGVSLRDMGTHRLKDLPAPEPLWQLVVPGLPAEFPTLKSLDHRPHNLPGQLTALLGREREVEAVRARLRGDEVRLVTLTGPGGSGKSRLSLQVARESLDEFEDGAFFVPLAPVSDPALVPSAVAAALNLKETPGQSPEQRIAGFLASKRLLLVLDNFEQVLPAAPFVSTLLRGCPALKVVVTSRAPLHVAGEREVPVPPLALPRRRPPPPAEQVSQYAAVRLFIERARAVKPDFHVTDDNAPAVAEICARLDGLPLAIELAAARVKLLPPAAMLSRLDGSLKLLTGVARDVEARQQTLRGAIGWSYDLLSEAEKTLFRRLSVFVGGFRLEAAEGVCGDLPLDVMDGTCALADQSLLRREDDDDGDEPRFGMLETIREFAREKLRENGEEAAARERHARWHLELAHQQSGSQPRRWLVCMKAEEGNLRAALAWCLENPNAALQLAAGPLFGWLMQHPSEARQWLERRLEKNFPISADHRKVLRFAGGIATIQHDYVVARRWLSSALNLSREAGDKMLIIEVCRDLRTIAVHQGDREAADAFGQESLALLQELRRESLDGEAANRKVCFETAFLLGGMGWEASERGELQRARGFFDQSLALFRELGAGSGEARILIGLGFLALTNQDYEEARALNLQALDVSRRVGDQRTAASVMRSLGDIACLQGDYAQANLRLRESFELYREIGSEPIIWLYLLQARIALREGNAASSRAPLAHALRLFSQTSYKLGLTRCLLVCGWLAAVEDRPERAAQLLGSEEAAREAQNLPPAADWTREWTFSVERAKSALGEAAFAAAWNEGRALPLEAAAAGALKELQV